ncbi:MAG TPA: alpha/beta hydrolase-fold protein [Ferruginibacter sp.]|nr:alpha/beta hydrolase-fold protein [Ferruginibacter sp.]
MSLVKAARILVENHTITSIILEREVKVDFYFPPEYVPPVNLSLLLINDGQDLVTMQFENILDDLYESKSINDLFCVGIHCSKDRKNEYGTANYLDYKGRGAKAGLYNQFVFEELMPFIRKTLSIFSFKEKCFAGFSLGGLCALDIVWNHPLEFSKVGVFSGSLWWRDKDQNDADFNEDTDRIMHKQVMECKNYYPWLKFFFEVGTLDEVADRNNNGVIDSIDDTVSFIEILENKGYQQGRDIKFIELKDGHHDVPTWALAFPEFLKWGWGSEDMTK